MRWRLDAAVFHLSLRWQAPLRYWQYFLLDDLQRFCLRAARVFHRGADHAAGVGDEVGQYQRAIFVQHALGFQRERNIGARRHEFGFQARDAVFAQKTYPYRASR